MAKITNIEQLREFDPEKAAKIERDYAAGKYDTRTADRLVKLALMDAK